MNVAEARILVVEDDADQRTLIADILRRQGHEVFESASIATALGARAQARFELGIAERRLGDEDAMTLLMELHARHGSVPFILITAYGTIAHAVVAMREGVDDYLAKPFEREALLLAVERTLRSRRLRDENLRLTAELGERDNLVDLIGRSASMQQVFRRLEKVAGTDATVLLVGESGTGKELAARALHVLSRRATGSFVAINCAAIPEGLVESEFFGAEKGSYTGADRQRQGRFEAADGGTLFLDEIGELPLMLQPKLLRVLQEGRVSRVGSSTDMPVDVRVVAASNRARAACSSAWRLREHW